MPAPSTRSRWSAATRTGPTSSSSRWPWWGRSHPAARSCVRALASGDRIVVTGSLGAAAGGLALSRAVPGRAAEALSQPWGRALIEALERPVRAGGRGADARARGRDRDDGSLRRPGEGPLAPVRGERGRRSRRPRPPSRWPNRCRAGPRCSRSTPRRSRSPGGEDYELLATLPADAVERAREELRSGFGVDLSEIGEIVEGSGVVAVDADGGTAPLEPAGWDHFAHG